MKDHLKPFTSWEKFIKTTGGPVYPGGPSGGNKYGLIPHCMKSFYLFNGKPCGEFRDILT